MFEFAFLHIVLSDTKKHFYVLSDRKCKEEINAAESFKRPLLGSPALSLPPIWKRWQRRSGRSSLPRLGVSAAAGCAGVWGKRDVC